jgi:hypothetical protein
MEAEEKAAELILVFFPNHAGTLLLLSLPSILIP